MEEQPDDYIVTTILQSTYAIMSDNGNGIVVTDTMENNIGYDDDVKVVMNEQIPEKVVQHSSSSSTLPPPTTTTTTTTTTPDTTLLINVTLDELTRCYNGNEHTSSSSLSTFIDTNNSNLMCNDMDSNLICNDMALIDNNNDDDDENDHDDANLSKVSIDKLSGLLYDSTTVSTTVNDDNVTPTMKKRIEVVWHDGGGTTYSESSQIAKSNEELVTQDTHIDVDRRWTELANVVRARHSKSAFYVAVAAMAGETGILETSSNDDDVSSSSYTSMGTIEDACLSTGDCDRIKPTIFVEEDDDATTTLLLPKTKKRIEVVWPKTTAQRQIPEAGSRHNRITLTDGERDGAILLGESFRLVSSMFGLAADALRFTGETAAVTAGGASRLAGGAVKVTGWAVANIGEAIENSGHGRHPATTAGAVNNDEFRRNKKFESNKSGQGRRIAGSSVRLLAGAIEQLADSLLLVGSAVEHVVFATAGAAEGTVRIMEDASSSLSDMFSREGKTVDVTRTETIIGELSSITDDVSLPDATGISPMKDSNDESAIFNNNILYQTEVAPSIDEILPIIRTWILRSMEIMVADTGGVSSLTYEMLGVFLLCFLASFLLLSSKTNDTGSLNTSKLLSPRVIKDNGIMRLKNITFYSRRIGPNNHDHDSHSTLTVESTMQVGPDVGSERILFMSSVFWLPMRLIRAILVFLWNLALSKRALLFILHMLGWIYLSRVAQYKSSVIQR